MTTTNIATADATSITVRGKDLCGALIGKVSFTEMMWLVVFGTTPTPRRSRSPMRAWSR